MPLPSILEEPLVPEFCKETSTNEKNHTWQGRILVIEADRPNLAVAIMDPPLLALDEVFPPSDNDEEPGEDESTASWDNCDDSTQDREHIVALLL
ncbi:expressed unknown protein [Seminavis robusta]|uniref:Uncharacterized protein n=1 Tax=Seminavis robusta TaxID=568900 RepID=A0A9N8E1K6_9STRA|nr:expressed unknown protein [Seminavis robusta]|eukprot:Sro559_g166450.1 n/a (95) ;mRNA; f:29751-30035